jgi:RNA polymerase sigma-70 factor (ECF subfamily)
VSEDESDFRTVYEANYAAVLGYALRRVMPDEASDVAADVFLTAWRRFADMPRGDEARLWLYATARRVVANRVRSERRRTRLRARLLREPADPPRLAPERELVAGAFGRLPAADREILSLVAWEGLSANEVARVLGCSANAARIRLHRARRRFASELERECPEPALGAAS